MLSIATITGKSLTFIRLTDSVPKKSYPTTSTDSIDFDIEYNKWIATQNFLESLGHEIEFFSATHPEDAMIIIDCVEFTPSKFKKLISSLNDLINTAQYFVENSEDYESVLKPDFDFAEDDYENKSGNLYGKDNI